MDQTIKILIFSLNGEYYATDIMKVERILPYEEPTMLPDVPYFVEGVINYEEKILPILNLNKKFKFSIEKNNEHSKIIVVKQSENKFGILVNDVYEVRDVENNIIEKAGNLSTNISQECIDGLIKLEDRIVILLNLEKILSKQDREEIF